MFINIQFRFRLELKKLKFTFYEFLYDFFTFCGFNLYLKFDKYPREIGFTY
jgi:hypothetical protein